MCGRFSLVTDADRLRHYYGLVNAESFAGARFNIAPSQDVAAVVAVNRERRLEYFRWGLLPFWAREKKLGYSTINARVETVASKPAFRNAFHHHRCIIPADGFYEWSGKSGHKQPWRIEPEDKEELFSFAGLWEVWEGDGEVIRSCTIIVGEANEVVSPVHSRMPVILPRNSWSTWLDPHSDDATLQSLLQSAPAKGMHAYRVGQHVNNPQNDDPACLAPA